MGTSIHDFVVTGNKKINVNEDEASPLFKFLKSKAGGLFGSKNKWNFTKFLIPRDGGVIKLCSAS